MGHIRQQAQLLFIALLAVVFVAALAAPLTQAFAGELSGKTGEKTEAQAIASGGGQSAGVAPHITLVYVPELSWDMLIASDNATLSDVTAHAGMANMIVRWHEEFERYADYDRVSILGLDGSITTADELAAALEQSLAGQRQGDVIVLLTGMVFSAAPDVYRDFSPVVIAGGNFDGLLTAPSTRRVGVLLASDLSAYLDDLLANDAPAAAGGAGEADAGGATATEHPSEHPTNLYVAPQTAQLDAQELLANLQHQNAVADAITNSKEPITLGFAAFVLLVFAISVLLLALETNLRLNTIKALVPIVRILWIVVIAFPISTFLMFIALPQAPSPTTVVLICLGWTFALALCALIIGYRTRWIYSLVFLFVLTIVTLLLDQLLGGPLCATGYLNYSPIRGVRYFGMGNEACALLFGAWITLSGILINRFSALPIVRHFKRWGFLVCSMLFIAIVAAPLFGASFGVLVWGVITVLVAWWLLNERRITWYFVLGVLALAGVVSLSVLYSDILYNSSSHMQWVEQYIDGNPLNLVAAIARSVGRLSWATLTYSPLLTLLFFALVAYLVILRITKPGPYKEFWQRNVAFRAVYTTGLMLIILMGFIEDSGIFMPALYLIFMMAGFVWLVCDLHRWQIREWVKNKARANLHELQRLGSHKPAEKTKPRTARTAPRHLKQAQQGDASPALAAPAASPEKPRQGDGAPVPEQEQQPRASSSRAQQEPQSSQPSVGRSTATMATATLLSRITGFVRTWALAFALGNTMFSSAYYVANNLPNSVYELVLGGVFSTAFLPLYMARLKERGKRGSAAYASNLLSIGVLVLGIIALLATVFAPQVVFTQTFMTQGSDAELAVFFFRFFAVQMVFYGVGAIIGGILNAHRNFLWPALGPLFNNLVIIVVYFGFPFISGFNQLAGMIWLAVGTTLGVVAMFAVQVPALLKLKLPLRFHINFKDPALRETLRVALPVTLFIIMSLITVSVMNAYSLKANSNGPTTLGFAWLWYMLPYGVIGVALSTALFTEMSAASAAKDWALFRANVSKGLRTTIFLILPLAALMFALAKQLAGLYHAGKFNYEDVQVVAQVLSCWCISLPFFAAYQFLYRAFSSLRDLKRFIKIDACGRVLQATLYAVLTTGIGDWGGLGLIGIPLADAITYALLFFVMSLVLQKRIGSFGLEAVLKDGGKTLVAALLAAALPAVVAYSGFDETIAISLVTVALCGLGGLTIFYLLCKLLKVPEVATISTLLSRVTGRLRRPRGGG
ncbi:MAG: murein biosynthesis integral membrane protein MurJ [Coriobacteriales bacterium]|jgi:putative peptidoglycan lipid II flippase|nr:murein biosynthesis integral membrane protein MurJ [Coriobacteriales bacterium]